MTETLLENITENIIKEWIPLTPEDKLNVIKNIEELTTGIELVKSSETQETTIQIITAIYNKWITLSDESKLDKIKLLEDTITGIALIQDSDNPK